MLGIDRSSDGTTDDRSAPASEPHYTRTLPGGGNVKVELLVSDRGDVAHERLRGRVVVDGHAAESASSGERVILEEVEGDDGNAVVDELVRIARDNAAIARRMLRQQEFSAAGDSPAVMAD